MKTLGLVANPTKARAPEVLRRIVAKAAALGLELLGDKATAGLVDGLGGSDLPAMLGRVDALMALGGDGTMLRAVRGLDGADKPVIGVNIGGLGFLTSVSEDELDRALHCLADDDYSVEVSAVLEIDVERGETRTAVYRALNDVIVTRGSSLRAVTLDVIVNGEPVTSYLCDGLIVATPVGSTGHSLSAGGPILAPRTSALVISPICPHALSSRPLVIPADSEIRVDGRDDGGDLLLSADGQVGQVLEAGDRVCVRRSRWSVRLIHLPGHSYFSVLRQKLRWSGSSV